jgi:hypothetical protein
MKRKQKITAQLTLLESLLECIKYSTVVIKTILLNLFIYIRNRKKEYGAAIYPCHH